jgi:hypothetical protein
MHHSRPLDIAFRAVALLAACASVSACSGGSSGGGQPPSSTSNVNAQVTPPSLGTTTTTQGSQSVSAPKVGSAPHLPTGASAIHMPSLHFKPPHMSVHLKP